LNESFLIVEVIELQLRFDCNPITYATKARCVISIESNELITVS